MNDSGAHILPPSHHPLTQMYLTQSRNPRDSDWSEVGADLQRSLLEGGNQLQPAPPPRPTPQEPAHWYTASWDRPSVRSAGLRFLGGERKEETKRTESLIVSSTFQFTLSPQPRAQRKNKAESGTVRLQRSRTE